MIQNPQRPPFQVPQTQVPHPMQAQPAGPQPDAALPPEVQALINQLMLSEQGQQQQMMNVGAQPSPIAQGLDQATSGMSGGQGAGTPMGALGMGMKGYADAYNKQQQMAQPVGDPWTAVVMPGM